MPVPDSLKENYGKLRDFAARHNLRDDWHEPDEQSVEASVTGHYLDNAMGDDPESGEELVVTLSVSKEGKETEEVHINLATLLALASRWEPV